MERLRRTAAPATRAHQLGEWGVPPRWRSPPMERLRGTGTTIGACPLAGGRGVLPHGDRCLRNVCRVWQPPSGRAHHLGGQGVMRRRRSVPIEHLRGPCAPISPGSEAGGTWCPAHEAVSAYGAPADHSPPNGPDSPARGTGSLAQAAVGAYGAPTRDGCAHRRGPTSLGDG